jgi:hypothetical protein
MWTAMFMFMYMFTALGVKLRISDTHSDLYKKMHDFFVLNETEIYLYQPYCTVQDWRIFIGYKFWLLRPL